MANNRSKKSSEQSRAELVSERFSENAPALFKLVGFVGFVALVAFFAYNKMFP